VIAFAAQSADVQYMEDVYVPETSDNDVSGWIAGVRLTVMY
jgi:hypothetical protein